MQKGSAQLLLIFIFVIIIFGGVYFYQSTIKESFLQNPNFTTSKQPEFNGYLNSDFGFGFKYSKDLILKVDSEEEFNKRGNGDFRKNFKGYVGYEPGKFIGAVVVLDKTNSFETNPFTVWVFENQYNLTVDSWFNKYWYYPFIWGVFDYTSKGHIALDQEATISGQLAKSKVVSYQPGQPKFIYVAKDKRMYLLRVIGHTGDIILSSFKFNQVSL